MYVFSPGGGFNTEPGVPLSLLSKLTKNSHSINVGDFKLVSQSTQEILD